MLPFASAATRDGVGASSCTVPDGAPPTVLAFLQARFPAMADEWPPRLARGLVVDDRGEALGADSRCLPGMRIRYWREVADEPEIPGDAPILFRDERLLVVDKPHFLPVMPAGRFVQQSLLVRLRRDTGIGDLAPLHRIDRGTAGVVLFSVNACTRGAYQQLFARREMHKRYEALAAPVDLDFPLTRASRIVRGEPFFRMREIAGEPNAQTRIALARVDGALARYDLWPLTGRTHQLRVHLAALGAPIVNDRMYPELLAEAEDDYSRPLKLLARSIGFVDPVSGEQREFSSARDL
jgi:tRNA pseudouridine32 synthase/23S rRNA pseudouridine746 synthase